MANGGRMTVATDALIVAAGILGGAINAVAGGATLFTFPAFLAAGLPPISANASSSVALTPGHLFAVIAERDKLPTRDGAFWLSLAIAIIGGVLGAYLLFATSERVFTALVPILIGGATLIFAFGKKLQAALKKEDATSTPARLAVLAPVSVYGGYFGAGMGVVLMAAFAMTTRWELRTANAMKNLLGALANWSAIAIFLATNLVAWRETLIMLVGAMLGALVGAKLLRSMPPHYIRYTVIAAGTVMTVIYAWRYWT
jgi:uncharacterized protein